jgi:hypothetical protein
VFLKGGELRWRSKLLIFWRFSEMEVLFPKEDFWSTIKGTPQDRVLGPNGFIGAFYQRAHGQ